MKTQEMYSRIGKGALLSTVFCLCLLLVQSSRPCNFPPSVWCSSRQIARACQVEEQCENNAWSIQDNAPKVNLTVFYETLCPDSIKFIDFQLWPTFHKVANIFNVELVPYGKAHEKQAGGVWEFTCQHGPMECVGNLIQTCAIHITGNVSTVLPFVYCMEMSDHESNDSAPVCAKKTGIDFASVKSCAMSPLGNRLQHKMGLKTEGLDPQLTFVPWITLNGVHTDAIQNEALSDLLKLVCDTYTGPKPGACHETKVLRKCHNENL